MLNQHGARNVWIAEAPAYQGRQLTHYSADDGQEIAEITWTPDGRSLIFVRGGDFEMHRDNPNPASLPQGVEQAIWIVPLAGGAPRKIAEGNNPAVSPQGDRLAFLRKNQIWSVALEDGAKPAQLIHAKGEASELRWSPDGSLLAFVSTRADHSFIAVYNVAAQSLLYLDPSVDQDSNPVWSPDGKQIAFVRIAASTRAFSFGPAARRPALVHSHRGRRYRKRPRALACFRRPRQRVSRHGQPTRNCSGARATASSSRGNAPAGCISTPSPRTATCPRHSTPAGEFEIEHASLSADRRTVLFSSNQNDIDRRHLWRVSVSGENLAPLTPGDGIEWSPVETSDGSAVAMLRSDARNPARARASRSAMARSAISRPNSIPGDFPASSLVVAAAGHPLRRRRPAHPRPALPARRMPRPNQKHPAVIFFHGGSRRQMLLGWHYMDYYNNAYAMNQYLASLGYIVLSVNYRSGIGYGLDFREALNYGATGASEFNDVLGAGLYLRSRPDVDPKRIGLWGGSYGGYLTALGLSRASDLFAVGVDFHGVHDWNDVITNFVPAYNPSKDVDAARIAFESSPMSSIGTWRSPVLLIHGDDDRNVPFHQTVDARRSPPQTGRRIPGTHFPR